ncbi:Sel1 repeat-containing protein 1B [Fasciola hepatica]|uniref:Sel1 repeat-containing protein 1B n=1 Tax=Fasciola hepatica TaxID=6192 RepID=A0A4E0R5L1_FASHE|nr:Sel1 repeat-containing protein 1B [Fasciola hepatica]
MTDSGMLDMKSVEEMADYMDELGLRFEYACKQERDPLACHSFSQWLETYKRSNKDCAEVLRENCFDLKYGDSCFKYGYLRLFGKNEIPRDPLAAFQAFEFGCKSVDHSKCCQAAGRLVAEGIASHAPSLNTAAPLFERGCKLGLAESCFHLGGASLTLAMRKDQQVVNPDSSATSNAIPHSAAELRTKALEAWLAACKLGHEFSCRNVSRMYKLGDGISANQAKAKEFLDLAEKIAAQKNMNPADGTPNPT